MFWKKIVISIIPSLQQSLPQTELEGVELLRVNSFTSTNGISKQTEKILKPGSQSLQLISNSYASWKINLFNSIDQHIIAALNDDNIKRNFLFSIAKRNNSTFGDLCAAWAGHNPDRISYGYQVFGKSSLEFTEMPNYEYINRELLSEVKHNLCLSLIKNRVVGNWTPFTASEIEDAWLNRL